MGSLLAKLEEDPSEMLSLKCTACTTLPVTAASPNTSERLAGVQLSTLLQCLPYRSYNEYNFLPPS